MLEAACHNIASWYESSLFSSQGLRMTLIKQRPDHELGVRVELGFMGNVLLVELPVGFDEQQMQTASSTHDLRNLQPVSPNPRVLFARFMSDPRVDIGCLTSRTTTTIDRVQRGDTPPLVNLGVSDSLGADISLWEFADYDQSGDLVATRFSTPGKNTNSHAKMLAEGSSDAIGGRLSPVFYYPR